MKPNKLMNFFFFLCITLSQLQPLSADNCYKSVKDGLTKAANAVDYIDGVENLFGDLGSNYVQLSEVFTGGKNAQISTSSYITALNSNNQSLILSISDALAKNTGDAFTTAYNVFSVALNQYLIDPANLNLLEALLKTTLPLSKGFLLMLNIPTQPFTPSQAETIVSQFDTYLTQLVSIIVIYNRSWYNVVYASLSDRETELTNEAPSLITNAQQLIRQWVIIGNYAAQIHEGTISI